jgi:Tfp pilus assembly protein PilE
MQRNQQQVMANQGGVSLSGLIVVLAGLGVLAVLVLKVVPSYAEYRSIKAGIAKAKASGGTVAEMRSSFDKNADINNVTSIRSRDLVFSRDGGDTDISFAYEKRIALAGNVSLVIDYTGTTDSSGQVAAKTASAEQQ